MKSSKTNPEQKSIKASFLVFFTLLILFSKTNISPDDLGQNCSKCHAMNNFSYINEDLKSLKNLTVNTDEFKKSVHGKLKCIDCHRDTPSYPHKEKIEKVGCNQDCHSIDEKGNPYNHSKQVNEFADSIHAKGKNGYSKDSPTCVSCHGYSSVHTIQKVTKIISQQEKISQCIACHDNTEMMIRNKVEIEAVNSYKQSFHYKAIKYGGVKSATCQDCHGVHKIHPRGHKESTISKDKIADTCGKSGCHDGANINFAMSGANHLKLRIDKEPILYWEEKLFQILTGGTMAMLVVGIVLDIQKKFGWISVLNKFLILLSKGMILIFKVGKAVFLFLKALLFD
jgi:hypothetical protein